MRLRRITIHNFRILRHIDIQVAKNPLLIIGENNVGKSCLLTALRLLLDPTVEGLRSALTEEDINTNAKTLGENYFSVRLELGELQKHPEVEACFRERIDQDDDETFITIEGKYEFNDEGEYSWSRMLLSPSGRHNEPIPMLRRMFDAIPLYFLDAVRDAERETRATGTGLLSQLLGDVDYADVQDDVIEYLKSANQALNRGTEISDLSDGLTNHLTTLIPGGQSKVVIVVADEDISRLARSFRLRLRKKPDVDHSDISRHGTGMQNLALVSMFRHQINKKQAAKPQKTPILAIEEPEAHLHPHAQRRLFKDLSDLKAPVIITTHSPAIVKYADPLSLVLLRTNDHDETYAAQLDSHFTSDELQNLARLMRNGRAEIVFARTAIIVEGPSEEIALPAFARSLGCDLDRDGISVVPAEGNQYGYILKTCQQLGIPTVVTYDTDIFVKSGIGHFLRDIESIGLINSTTLDSVIKDIPNVVVQRRAVLDSIGWIGVESCFEEVVCDTGYIPCVRELLEKLKGSDHLIRYLNRKGLSNDAKGLAQYIDYANLKIAVAHCIHDEVEKKNLVPECYTKAIQKATLLSLGGIIVDDDFELRACAAGFKMVIEKTIRDLGCDEHLNNFVSLRTAPTADANTLHEFLCMDDIGKQIRNNVLLDVATAVHNVGCEDFANAIRSQSL